MLVSLIREPLMTEFLLLPQFVQSVPSVNFAFELLSFSRSPSFNTPSTVLDLSLVILWLLLAFGLLLSPRFVAPVRSSTSPFGLEQT